MKLQSYCGITFFCYFIVIGLASQNGKMNYNLYSFVAYYLYSTLLFSDDDHTDSSIYKKKKKPNPSVSMSL
jgi:hypothetical protein